MASGIYPAFDVTPADLITGIITDKGVFAPNQIGDYLIKP
jgi:methylthioribose-1-phosphate isomerase